MNASSSATELAERLAKPMRDLARRLLGERDHDELAWLHAGRAISAATRATRLVVLPLPAPADTAIDAPGSASTHGGSTMRAGRRAHASTSASSTMSRRQRTAGPVRRALRHRANRRNTSGSDRWTDAAAGRSVRRRSRRASVGRTPRTRRSASASSSHRSRGRLGVAHVQVPGRRRRARRRRRSPVSAARS